MNVEFRLLQVVLSAVSGDRVTAALVHWDGAHLRVASSRGALSVVDPAHRDGIRTAVEDFVRRAERRALSLGRKPELDAGLAHIFPVREGAGAALYWTPVACLETRDAGAHFVELERETRLAHEPPPRRPVRVTERKVYAGLVSLGEQLRSETPAWVRTSHKVSYKMSYDAPLSWKNGAWHHAVPLSLDGRSDATLEAEIRQAYGLVDLSVPVRDTAVLIPAMRSGGALTEDAKRELSLLRVALKGRRMVEVVAPTSSARGLDFGALAKRVREDVKAH
jgi:hypothetical protein